MATLTIRRLDATTHELLRGRAARHGRSVEAEVRAILSEAVQPPRPNVLVALHESFASVGGLDLEVPSRGDAPREVELA
jgi:plasmid stability protein